MAVEVIVPRLGWSMESGLFGQWLKQDGEIVTVGDPVFSIEGEKATEEVESEDVGFLHIRPGLAKPGAELTVGTVIGWLLAEGESIPQDPPNPIDNPMAEPEAKPVPPPGAAAVVTVNAASCEQSDGRLISSPRARRSARELGVDWRLASGSGKGGRIRERDVRALAAGLTVDGVVRAITAPMLDQTSSGPLEVIPLTTARRLTAERLVAIAQTVPMATQLGTADVTRLEALLKRYGSNAQTAGRTLTMAAILAKVAATALKLFPQCNESLDFAAGLLVRRSSYNVGIAVDGRHGTSFPVVCNVDQKNLLQLSVEIADLVARAHLGTLEPTETQGACMSIYELGGTPRAGIGHFTPVVNTPEAAILGIAPTQREPVVDESSETVVQRLRMPLGLTYDCRVIDGTYGMRFLHWIIEALEEPLLLSLEG